MSIDPLLAKICTTEMIFTFSFLSDLALHVFDLRFASLVTGVHVISPLNLKFLRLFDFR